MKESEVLTKALDIILEALDGRPVDPNALDTAIRLTQFLWSSVYAEKLNINRILEANNNKWSDTVEPNNKDEK